MFGIAGAATALALGLLGHAQQVVFGGVPTAGIPFAVASNVSIETRSLASIASQDEFLALAHPKFPAHQVRVKKSKFCDPTVSVYTGYLDVDNGAKHLFFSFFESRRDPDNDDVMMWVSGGPGCSSSMGLLMELGPCNIDMKNISENGTTWNPHSWNEEANIFFLDQPVGVGFSYAEYGETVDTTEDAAKNVYAFLMIFFETFSQFKGRALHLAGESYAGKYLPVFASYVHDQNQIALGDGRDTLNMTSVIIGNGFVDVATRYRGRYEVECGTASLETPFQSISNCVNIQRALPRCEKAMQLSCLDTFDAIGCLAAVSFCNDAVSGYFKKTGRNNFDVTMHCSGEFGTVCYAEGDAIKTHLDNPSMRDLLGVESPSNFTLCDMDVGERFDAHLDAYVVPSQFYLAGLLERGVRLLLYSGTYDWQSAWPGTDMWLEKLEWTGSGLYRSQTFRDWHVDGHKAGEVRAGGPLTFVTVLGGGHMMSIGALSSILLRG